MRPSLLELTLLGTFAVAGCGNPREIKPSNASTLGCSDRPMSSDTLEHFSMTYHPIDPNAVIGIAPAPDVNASMLYAEPK